MSVIHCLTRVTKRSFLRCVMTIRLRGNLGGFIGSEMGKSGGRGRGWVSGGVKGRQLERSERGEIDR